MAIPIAVAGAAIVRPYAILPGTLLSLDGSASYDPDGSPIDAYLWTLIDRPPSSAAALVDAATATPDITPDLQGTYLAFLRVQSGREWSAAHGTSAPDSAYCAVVVTSRNQAIRIPGAGERAWAPHLYDALRKLDEAVGTIPGGPAPSLQTTGSPVDVAAAAPPSAGKVLVATDPTHATWEPMPAPPAMSQWMWIPPVLCATSDSIGAANRVKTRSIVLPCQIPLSAFGIKVNGSGGGADLCALGLYDKATGALVAKTAATDSTGWAPSMKDIAVDGGPVSVPAGEYVLVWTASGTNLSLIGQAAYNNSWDGWDDADGYDSAVSAAGVLPAALNMVFTPDNTRGFPWICLRG